MSPAQRRATASKFQTFTLDGVQPPKEGSSSSRPGQPPEERLEQVQEPLPKRRLRSGSRFGPRSLLTRGRLGPIRLTSIKIATIVVPLPSAGRSAACESAAPV